MLLIQAALLCFSLGSPALQINMSIHTNAAILEVNYFPLQASNYFTKMWLDDGIRAWPRFEGSRLVFLISKPLLVTRFSSLVRG